MLAQLPKDATLNRSFQRSDSHHVCPITLPWLRTEPHRRSIHETARWVQSYGTAIQCCVNAPQGSCWQSVHIHPDTFRSCTDLSNRLRTHSARARFCSLHEFWNLQVLQAKCKEECRVLIATSLAFFNHLLLYVTVLSVPVVLRSCSVKENAALTERMVGKFHCHGRHWQKK